MPCAGTFADGPPLAWMFLIACAFSLPLHFIKLLCETLGRNAMLSSLEAALREADDRYAKHEFDSSYYTCLWTAVHTQDAQTDAGHGQATAPALFVQSRHTASHACRGRSRGGSDRIRVGRELRPCLRTSPTGAVTVISDRWLANNQSRLF